MNARFLILLLTLSISFNALAQDNQRFENIEITTTKITEGIYMLAGDGGNMGVSIGKDGVFLIDDQYAPLTDKIVNAIGKISDDKIHFVFNTHYHDDHTGGNENLGKMGIDIVAHDDVYNRLSNGQHKENITPDEIQTIEDGLPIISYNDTLTFHMNDIEITTKHYAHAQTDSDSVIYFEGKNVIHMGDIFENSGYPYVDIDAGGHL
jgi:cyclase